MLLSAILQFIVATSPALTDSFAVEHTSAHAASRLARPLFESHSRATPTFDAGFYHLSLDLHFQPNLLRGATLVQGHVAEGTLSTLALDFDDNMTVDSVRSDAGALLDFSHTSDVLEIALPRTYGAGEVISVEVRYHGVPSGQPLAFTMGPRGDGTLNAWSLSEPYGARQWWPSKDHPSDKADSVRVTVTVPDPLLVASNGLPREVFPAGEGRTTFDWVSNYPIATYLVSIAAGVYDVRGQFYERPDSLAAWLGPLSLPIAHYEIPGSTLYEGTNTANGWKRVVDVMPLLEYWFGAYPFSAEKYGHAYFPWGGGMEHQTISSMGANGIGLVVHELAHQWFGDLITMANWPHLWLNEGFATYAELLYWEATNDWYNADTDPANDDPYPRIFDLYYNRALTAQGTVVVEDTTTFANLFDGRRVYAKGGMVLHMLRSIVGDEAFRDILRTYVGSEEFRYGTALTDDFRRVAESVSSRDLARFFEQWVTHGTGHPRYDVSWEAEASGAGYKVTATLTQTQDLQTSNVEVFEMPVTFEIRHEAGVERFLVQNDARAQSFRFEVAAAPTEVIFDPERAILREDPGAPVGAPPVAGASECVRIRALYPDPAYDRLTVAFDACPNDPAVLTLYDVTGRRVLERGVPHGASNVTLEVSSLPSGLYVVKISDARSWHAEAVVVAR